ncbi:hypothetical protein BCR34DRAFT_591839 [Clohesyomyces aquaticus]|uniref:Uncharacterized protein n=1 Tax=Clohesyomyces aquaticus TaxID=1231657 RepID=A0A1Y1YY77_9PLEO|nr:hypothetical protein BCR34DRAFT_591839 [Clohesyomyces aquaticus]
MCRGPAIWGLSARTRARRRHCHQWRTGNVIDAKQAARPAASWAETCEAPPLQTIYLHPLRRSAFPNTRPILLDDIASLRWISIAARIESNRIERAFTTHLRQCRPRRLPPPPLRPSPSPSRPRAGAATIARAASSPVPSCKRRHILELSTEDARPIGNDGEGLQNLGGRAIGSTTGVGTSQVPWS